MPRPPLALYFFALSIFSAFAIDRAEFIRMVTEFSEPDGYFDTDNLISNETTYLDAASALRELRKPGGIYLGVGPDQNFSYMAHLRPEVAFMVDIRRGNLLEHLLFRTLFEQSRNRVEYLCLLLGKAVPANLKEWNDLPIRKIVDYIDSARPSKELFDSESAEVQMRILGLGLKLTQEDLSTIRGFHQRFFADGLDLRFNTHGRAPQPYYPKFRDLIVATGTSGKPESYLATEESFQFVKQMQEENRVVPVIANLAGPKALRQIAGYAKGRKLTIRAFYVSNVEQYLSRDGDLEKFAENVKALPHDASSILIRSIFGGFTRRSYSEQLIQRMENFVTGWDSGKLGSYQQIVRASQAATLTQ